MLKRFQELINSYPYKQNSYLKNFGITQRQIDNYFLDWIKRLISKKTFLVVVEEKKAVNGLASYSYQDFDTKVLGLKTVKVNIALSDSFLSSKLLVLRLVDSFKINKIEYATIRLCALDLELVHALEENGFKSIDSYLTLLKKIDSSESLEKDSKIIIRTAKLTDIQKLQDRIAYTFIYSRYFQDPVISQEHAIQIHRKWIENSIIGKVADYVLVAEYEREPIGLIALEMDRDSRKYFNKKICHITLIGIDPKFYGQHLAKSLTDRAFNSWCKDQGVEYARIETQITNIPAIRSYENMGFRSVDSAQTLRWSKQQ